MITVIKGGVTRHYTNEEYEILNLREENEKMISILANVRDKLIPLIDKDNECGDMVCCLATNYECINCLVENISNKFLKP